MAAVETEATAGGPAGRPAGMGLERYLLRCGLYLTAAGAVAGMVAGQFRAGIDSQPAAAAFVALAAALAGLAASAPE